MKINESALKEKVLGCVLGGAIGDALGAPFEGLWSHSIPSKAKLLANYSVFEGYTLGQFTDDTQLTIATVESIIKCGYINPANIARCIFQLWKAQAVIGPGGACSLAASQFFLHGDWQKSGAMVGSAGNGTAMRTAVLGFCFLDKEEKLPIIVSDVSRITHQDPRSIAGGVAIAKACQLLVLGRNSEEKPFYYDIAQSIENIDSQFSKYLLEIPNYPQKSDETLNFIAWSGMHYPEFDKPIITPFVIPTVLAALWVVMKHPNSWSDAVSEVIGLGGDVDTLGAIVGGLMGAKLGISSIPNHLIQHLVKKEKLTKMAEKYYYLISGKLGSKLESQKCN